VPENDSRLAELSAGGIWDEVSLASQEYVLGRVDGVELELSQPDGAQLTVFTPYADALADACFVLISPRHPEADVWAADVQQELEQMRSGGWERSAREAETIPLIDTGRMIAGPDGRELPVIVSPIVDSRFGVAVVLGIPAADHTDEVLAQRLGLVGPTQALADTVVASAPDNPSSPREDPGTAAARTPIDSRRAVRYKAYDFAISRQRSWGTPIPIVYCEQCGMVPVPREQLPVLLPLNLRPTGAGNPLAELDEFVNTTCPTCGGPARRETDTLDCHFDALWLWIPACVPPDAREDTLEEILALGDLRHWLPSERLVAGSDSGNFVFDQRIVTKALRDIGPLSFLADGEPFAGCLFHEMVIRDGRKMSKHLGNVVDPDELVARYGADTVRLAVLYAARPQRSLNWSDSAVLRCHRFLTQVWDYSLAKLAQTRADGAPQADGDGDGEPVRDTTEHLRVKLASWCENGVKRITQDMESLEMHSAVRNVMRLFDRIKDFEKRVLARQAELGPANSGALIEALTQLVQVLGPLAPHMAEELWIAFGGDEHSAQTPWPGVSLRVPA
jgi:leucyl-tRNA synthetase